MKPTPIKHLEHLIQPKTVCVSLFICFHLKISHTHTYMCIYTHTHSGYMHTYTYTALEEMKRPLQNDQFL